MNKRNKLWKKFDRLTEECYADLEFEKTDISKWNNCFNILLEIISDGRQVNLDFAKELYMLDEETDYCYDVQGWIEDYMDELDTCEMYEELESVCRRLLKLFDWKEEYPADIRFALSSALCDQGRHEEALKYCEDWVADEKDNPMAVAALIHTKINMKDFEGGEKVVRQYITEDTVCTDENSVIFVAALRLYKEMARKIADALNEYDEGLGEFLTEMDDEDFVFDEEVLRSIDEELPFD